MNATLTPVLPHQSGAPRGDDHTADEGPRGRYKLCENCGVLYFLCLDSTSASRGCGLNHCCFCRDQVTRSRNQLWECIKCGCARAWGVGRPQETCAADLNCRRCQRVTVHSFWKVA